MTLRSHCEPTGRPALTLVATLLISCAASGVGAATLHRFTVTQTSNSGSLGATTFDSASTSGGALQGQGGGAPDTSVPFPFGVFGEYNDNSSGTFGIGTIGVSTTGYGVAAEAIGPNPAVYVLAKGTGGGIQVQNGSSGYGLQISNPSSSGYAGAVVQGGAGIGVYGQSNYDYGVYAVSDNESALYATTGVEASGSAVLGARTGEGAVINGYSGSAAHPALAVADQVGGSDLIGTYRYVNGSTAESFIVQAGTADRSNAALASGSDVQISGDLYVYGKIFQDCFGFPVTSNIGCYDVLNATSPTTSIVARTSNGRNVETFPSRQGSPSLEDVGTGRVVDGVADVRLDPTFASTISLAKPYAVFITPDGENHGVFVSRKSPQGFEVRESLGGRSTFDFDYRIVAAPLGEGTQRFPSAGSRMKSRTGSAPTDPSIARFRKDRVAATHRIARMNPGPDFLRAIHGRSAAH